MVTVHIDGNQFTLNRFHLAERMELAKIISRHYGERFGQANTKHTEKPTSADKRAVIAAIYEEQIKG